jgi:uncharacterized phage protein gp47/JayE
MAAFDYTSRDFTTIKADLLARAEKVLPEWTDRDPADFGMLMIDLWAYAADVMHYYIDRVAGESYLPTATQRESVLALANLLDYTPRTRVAAKSSITLRNDNSTIVFIPQYTEFIARHNDVAYPVWVDTGASVTANGTGTVPVREGTLYLDELLTAAGAGTPGQTYSLVNSGVDASSIVVYVYEDGVTPVPYQRIARLTDALAGDRVFTTSVSANNYTTISFGTSSNGFVPPANSKITATYATCNGAGGNFPANAVVGFKGSAPSSVSVDSSLGFSGGVDDESIDSLKASIPSVVSAQDRAVTRDDFVSLARQVVGVEKATVSYSPATAASVSASVTIYAHGPISDYLTTSASVYAVPSSVQSDVVAFVSPRALLGVNVYAAASVTWQPIDVALTVKVNDRYVASWVKSDVLTAVDEIFDFDNVFFGQKVTLAQVYKAVMDVPGVDYCNVTVFDVAGGGTLQSTITVNALRLPKKGTVSATMVGGITAS